MCDSDNISMSRRLCSERVHLVLTVVLQKPCKQEHLMAVYGSAFEQQTHVMSAHLAWWVHAVKSKHPQTSDNMHAVGKATLAALRVAGDWIALAKLSKASCGC